MKRTNTFAVKFRDNDKVMELARACSAFWNVINYKRRQSFFEGEIDYDTDEEYRSFAPNIGSATAQQIIRKNDEAWKSFFKLKKMKKEGKLPPHIRKVSPPGYWKDRKKNEVIPRALFRCDCYKIKGRTIRLPKGIRGRIRGNLRWDGKQGRLELHYDEMADKW
jgi:putative transposase